MQICAEKGGGHWSDRNAWGSQRLEEASNRPPPGTGEDTVHGRHLCFGLLASEIMR